MVVLVRLAAGCAPRCPLKMLTGVPCFTCGGTRALQALLDGRAAEALRLQPLLTLLAAAAVAWVVYAVVGPLCHLPRVRARPLRRGRILLVAAAVALVLANWAYLIADGR